MQMSILGMFLLTTIAAVGIFLFFTFTGLAIFLSATLPFALVLYWRRKISQYSPLLSLIVIVTGFSTTYLASLGPCNMLVPLAQRYPDHIATRTVLTFVDFVYAPVISNGFKRRLADAGLLRLYFSYQRDWVQYGTWLFGPEAPNR